MSFQDPDRAHHATYTMSQHNALRWVSISSLLTSGCFVAGITTSLSKDEYSYGCVRMVPDVRCLESDYHRKKSE